VSPTSSSVLSPTWRLLPGIPIGILLLFLTQPAHSDSVFVTAIADTTLIEIVPTNNMGGAWFVNAGTTEKFTRNRALLRFDLADQIPRGATIRRVDFVIEVTGQPNNGFARSSFGLHRALKPWGEGNQVASDPLHPGLGAPATTNEATWLDRFAFTTNRWTIPGGAFGNDYSPLVSAEEQIYGVGDSPYTFASTPALVADVQTWLDDPTTNFGWILMSQVEQTNFTARRFASREDAGRAPYLVIEYAPPRIDLVTVTNGQFNLTFAAQANQAYTVEFRAGFSASDNWSILTNLAAPPTATNTIVSDCIANGRRFYRLRLP